MIVIILLFNIFMSRDYGYVHFTDEKAEPLERWNDLSIVMWEVTSGSGIHVQACRLQTFFSHYVTLLL